jgi:hypothetical protein
MREITEKEVNEWVLGKSINELINLGTDFAKEQPYLGKIIHLNDKDSLCGLVFYLYYLLKQKEVKNEQ